MAAFVESGSLRRLVSDLDPAYLRRACILPGLAYPFWYFVGPQPGATDPWIVWLLLGGCLASIGFASFSPRPSRRSLMLAYHGVLWLMALQLHLLAFLNDMQLFYAMGSAMAVIATSALVRDPTAMTWYLAFVVSMQITLFVLAPDWHKVAWWGVSQSVLVAAHFRTSSQKTTVQAAQEYEVELERRVDERTRSLKQRTLELQEYAARLQRESQEKQQLESQLRFSQKMEAIGRMAGGVAHDFNNLLTAISGYADILANDVREQRSREDIQQIKLATEQATALVQQLLAFSRERYVPSTVLDVNAVVGDGLGMLRSFLPEDVELSVDLSQDVDRVRANRNQVQQVVLNLVLNARDAMPDGGRLSIETYLCKRDQLDPEIAQLAEGERYVVLAVSDTGVGMSDEVRTQAFEPFFTTKADDRGTGLGLSIVYGIVQQSGGHIRLLSGPGEGTRIEIFWPSVKDHVEHERPPRQQLPASGRREAILLVEDRDDVRSVVRRVLTRSGFRVVEASDGEQALRLATSGDESLDLVLADVVMPRMGGVDLAERLRERHCRLPVLFMSGHRDHPTRGSRPLPKGATLLAKPFAPAELVDAVRAALDGGDSRPSDGDEAPRPAKPAPFAPGPGPHGPS